MIDYHTQAHKLICKYIYIYIYIYINIYIYIIHNIYTYICIYTYIHNHIYISYIYIRIIYIYIRYMCVCIYIYIVTEFGVRGTITPGLFSWQRHGVVTRCHCVVKEGHTKGSRGTTNTRRPLNNGGWSSQGRRLIE